jgi:hypothetical protein
MFTCILSFALILKEAKLVHVVLGGHITKLLTVHKQQLMIHILYIIMRPHFGSVMTKNKNAKNLLRLSLYRLNYLSIG